MTEEMSESMELCRANFRARVAMIARERKQWERLAEQKHYDSCTRSGGGLLYRAMVCRAGVYRGERV